MTYVDVGHTQNNPPRWDFPGDSFIDRILRLKTEF
jgi:hypothetical protein